MSGTRQVIGGSPGRALLRAPDPSLLEQDVVVYGVVAPIDQEVLAVDTQQRALGDVGGIVLHLVAAEDGDRRSVLRTDQDGPARTFPGVAELLAEVVEEWCAVLGVVEIDGGGQLPGDVDDPVLRHDHRRADVRHVVVAHTDRQHRGVRVRGSVGVGRVERAVPVDVHRCAMDPVELLGVHVVGNDRCRAALHQGYQVIDIFADKGAAGQQANQHSQRNTGANPSGAVLSSHEWTPILYRRMTA